MLAHKCVSSMLLTMSCAVPVRQNAADAPQPVRISREPNNHGIEKSVSMRLKETIHTSLPRVLLRALAILSAKGIWKRGARVY